MNKKLVLSGLTILVMILAGLAYRFYPYFLYQKTSHSIPEPTVLVKEPTQPMDLSGFQDYLSSLDRSKIQAVADGIRVLEQSMPNYENHVPILPGLEP